jgi:hypothetical protein
MTGAAAEIAPGIWCWERRPRGLRPGAFGGRTSYAVTAGGDALLIDPLVTGDDDPALPVLDDLVAAGGVRILVTMPYHARSAEQLWHRYRRAGARIHGHPQVATRLADRTGFTPVAGGVVGPARFHPVGNPPRSEQAIQVAERRAVVLGDAVVETGGGELRLWAAPLGGERRRKWWCERYLPTIERLAALDVEHVLVTHGRPALGDGTALLRRAMQREPWQRPAR